MPSDRAPSEVGTVSFISVLRSVDTRKPATKRIYRDKEGAICKEAYGNAYKFICRRHPVGNIVELGHLLAALEKDQLSFIIGLQTGPLTVSKYHATLILSSRPFSSKSGKRRSYRP